MTSQPTRRQRLRESFSPPARSSRCAAALELLLIVAAFGLVNLLPLPRTTLPLFVLAWASLWLRGLSWRTMGLRRPGNAVAMIVVGLLVAGAAFLLGRVVILPLLATLTGEPQTSTSQASLQGNWSAFLLLLGLTWPLAAFLEELVFRGYLLNRLEDALGRTRLGTVSSVILTSALFALAHGNYSAGFLTTSFLMGLIEGLAYLAWRRNLWMPILIHGMANTLSFAAAVLGAS